MICWRASRSTSSQDELLRTLINGRPIARDVESDKGEAGATRKAGPAMTNAAEVIDRRRAASLHQTMLGKRARTRTQSCAVKTLIIVALILVPLNAMAAQKTVTCTGRVIDVAVTKRPIELGPGPKPAYPLAVIYDEEGEYTCVIDRGDDSGHEPLKGCSPCRIVGTIEKRVDAYTPTFWIKDWRADQP